MFNYEKSTYNITNNDDENYYWTLMNMAFGIFSPFEVTDIDFPKKDELGGAILKYIGSGAAYFKVQREKPSAYEVKSVQEVCLFLKEKFGGYITANMICEPHIEIHDIDVSQTNYLTYTSIRKTNGDKVLKSLTEKLENNEKFTIDDHIQRYLVPFTSRKNNDEFQKNYDRFEALFKEKNIEFPTLNELKMNELTTNNMYGENNEISILKSGNITVIINRENII